MNKSQSKIIKITLEGVSPLVFNRFTEENQMAATNGVSAVISSGKGTPREQAEKTLWTDEKGKHFIPQSYILGCITNAGKFVKIGKSKVTTQKTSLVPAALTFNIYSIPIIHKEPWEVYSTPVRNPTTGGRFLKHRALFNDWKISFELEVDETMFDVATIRDLIDLGGKRVGVGDYRPGTKGPYGKFVVTRWEIEK